MSVKIQSVDKENTKPNLFVKTFHMSTGRNLAQLEISIKSYRTPFG